MDSFVLPVILVFSGFIPSLIWLTYYLRKDCHPEPKSMIAKTMLLGFLMAPLAVVAQWLFSRLFSELIPGYLASTSLFFFLWAALVEEYVKFSAVRLGALHDPAFDEPTDAIIYMISAALGFAAIENVLVLFQTAPNGLTALVQIGVLRFAGATLLHAVSSALLGYCLALSWFYAHHSRKLIAGGLALATFVHFVFNLSLLTAATQPLGFVYSTTVLLALVILTAVLFRRLRLRMGY